MKENLIHKTKQHFLRTDTSKQSWCSAPALSCPAGGLLRTPFFRSTPPSPGSSWNPCHQALVLCSSLCRLPPASLVRALFKHSLDSTSQRPRHELSGAEFSLGGRRKVEGKLCLPQTKTKFSSVSWGRVWWGIEGLGRRHGEEIRACLTSCVTSWRRRYHCFFFPGWKIGSLGE